MTVMTRLDIPTPDLSLFAELVPLDHGLAVIAIALRDGATRASVVCAGVLDHPLTDTPVVGIVVAGNARKLAHLRAHPRATVVLRSGFRWAAVEGPVELIGPEDAVAGIDAERVRLLLREIFSAAGGTHEDLDEYDRIMATERRTAVLITPAHVYSTG
jgi:hypothetical protein